MSIWKAVVPSDDVTGWDIGGIHLKAAAVRADGTVRQVIQLACPLWQDPDRLEEAMDRAPAPFIEAGVHAVTMTGELADCFPDRREGVRWILETFSKRLGAGNIRVFGGRAGFLTLDAAIDQAGQIASANWLASAVLAAGRLPRGLLIDIGSTTTDVLVFAGGEVRSRGCNDHERLRYEELIYTGVVRAPVMAIAACVPFAGEWVSLAAEHFATMADVYRLTGELPPHADLLASSDGGGKSVPDSARRLARMLGMDAQSASPDDWRRTASYLADCQFGRIRQACERQLSRGLLKDDAPVVGAGVGRFLARALASRMERAYIDFNEFFPDYAIEDGSTPADCAPAVAVAVLAGDRSRGAVLRTVHS